LNRIGEYVSSIAVFNTDPYKLIEAAKEVDRVISDSMTLIWCFNTLMRTIKQRCRTDLRGIIKHGSVGFFRATDQRF
jgi:hypothetical protein